ncbi:MAG: DUF2306 domain-containing protein, partial [Myxococcota bacterium]
WMGRLTGLVVLTAVVPSGVILSFEAKGGPMVTLGFLLSGAIVAAGMVYGVVFARRKKMASHAWAMRHVTAQMSVAVTSRAMLVALDIGGVDPDTAYVAALWIPVVASALVVEWISRRPILAFLKPHPAPGNLT